MVKGKLKFNDQGKFPGKGKVLSVLQIRSSQNNFQQTKIRTKGYRVMSKLLDNYFDVKCVFRVFPRTKIPSNKAGYTANTSRGRVGMGGNARFHTFQLVFTDGPTDGRTDGPTDRTDKGSYIVACPQLKS